MSSNTQEKQIASSVDANEPQTQVSMSDDVRSVLSENAQLRENLKDTISSLDERNFSSEAQIYNLKQQNITLWSAVKRENTEIEQIKKEIQQLETEHKLELVKRDELSNKNLSIRLVTDELKNYVKKILNDKNSGEVEANNNYKRKETIKLELEGLNQQFDSLANYLLQERQKYLNELSHEEIEDVHQPLKLAHEIASKKNELMQMKLEIEQVMKKINEQNSIISNAQKNSQLTKEAIAAVQSEIIAVEKAIKHENLELDKNLAELQNEIAALETKIENTKNSIEQLKGEKLDVENRVEIMKISNKSITEGILPLKEKMYSLSESETSLRNEIESLKSSIEPLIGVEARHDELSERMRTVQDNVQGLSASISCHKTTLDDFQGRHVDLQQLLDSMQQQSKSLLDETKLMKQQYDEVASLTAHTEKEHDLEETELRETLDGFLKQIEEHEQLILEAKAEDEQLSKAISETKLKIEELSKQKRDIEGQLESLNEMYKTLEKTLIDEKTSYQLSFDGKTDELRQITSKIESMGNLSAELQAHAKEYEDLVTEKNSDLEHFKKATAKAELELKNYVKEKKRLSLSMERDYELAENDLLEKKTNYLKKISELKKSIDALTIEGETLSNKLSRYNQLKRKLEKHCANYERMMARIKNELSVTKRDIYNVIYKEKK
ncbi:COP1-interactive protein 1 isoform X3 [Nilaparvata lugens]|uniref:COP1-interactive protein 1 isoform X3 n=1 Tax=Nilaparvata lugens TaxID=108931 RepID=UPI00193CE7E1|nr:COP1-interactive protein 1 isoform X3 [Nilaparvata lugens]